MPASILQQSVLYDTPIGPIGDTIILACTDDAPALFGFDRVEDLVGQHMSYLQDSDWRLFGHQRYLDRKLGKRVSNRYAVAVRHPDGAVTGQERIFGGYLYGRGGEELYHTVLQPVSALSHCTIRDLNEHEAALYQQYMGQYTMADVDQLLAQKDSTLDGMETFQDIISQCSELSSGPFAGKYRRPLDLFVSPDITAVWRSFGTKAPAAPQIRARYCCEQCGYVWFGRAKRKGQCPYKGCRKNYAW